MDNYLFKIKEKRLEDMVPVQVAMGRWERSHYDHEEAGDYSATDLIRAPREVRLAKRYPDEIQTKLESQVTAFVGTGVHDLYERMLTGHPDFVVEQRIKHVVNDRLITGKFDILHKNQAIYDIKTTKVWHIIFDPDLTDWHQQQNIYAYLLGLSGNEIKSINILAHYLDWVESSALRDSSYPQRNVVEYELSLWPRIVTEEFIKNRLELHKSCENTPDDELPDCTPEERWERHPDGSLIKYALFKNEDAKRATKVFDIMEEAQSYGRGNKGFGPESFIEVRYAQRKKCEKYCGVAHLCNSYQEYKGRVLNGKLNDYIPLYR